jgi:hypothetical protein
MAGRLRLFGFMTAQDGLPEYSSKLSGLKTDKGGPYRMRVTLFVLSVILAEKF